MIVGDGLVYRIVRIGIAEIEEIRSLAQAAQAEGYRFLNRLVQDLESGENRFDKSGEALFGVYESNELIAVGGLNVDPYSVDKRVGRVRRVYVKPSHRRRGVGALLLKAIVEQAKGRFDTLHLRTDTEAASAFYCSLGFQNEPLGKNHTHYLRLAKPGTSHD